MMKARARAPIASIAFLVLASCSGGREGDDPPQQETEWPSQLTRGPIKLTYITDEFEDRYDRKEELYDGKKQGVCTFSAGAGVLLMYSVGKGVAIINDARVELVGTSVGAKYPVLLSGDDYTVTVNGGSPLQKKIAKDQAASLTVKGSEGEAVFSPGLWTCFPLKGGKRASQ